MCVIRNGGIRHVEVEYYMCVIRNGGIRHVEVEYIICVLLGMEALDVLKWSIRPIMNTVIYSRSHGKIAITVQRSPFERRSAFTETTSTVFYPSGRPASRSVSKWRAI